MGDVGRETLIENESAIKMENIFFLTTRTLMTILVKV